MDYSVDSGAKRNFEVWRSGGEGKEETEEERLDRLEREEEEKNVMGELEAKTEDAKREMLIADALDEIRTRNARNERVDRDGGVDLGEVKSVIDEERERQEREDEEAARRAFTTEGGEKVRRLGVEEEEEEQDDDGLLSGLVTGKGAGSVSTKNKDASLMPPPPLTFKRAPKKKKDFAAALGIKKKPALV